MKTVARKNPKFAAIMITPRFSLSQTDTQLIINIHAPYTNVKDTEIHVNDDDFRFFSSPYYLR